MQAADTNARRSGRRRVLPLTLVALGALVLAAAPASARDERPTAGLPAGAACCAIPARVRRDRAARSRRPAKRRRRPQAGAAADGPSRSNGPFRGTGGPGGFLGLSFEVGSLGQLAGYADSGDLVTLLRSLGPGVMRFGGVTADKNVAWVDARSPAGVGFGGDRRRRPARLGSSPPAAAGTCC